MALAVLERNHFDGGANLNDGQRDGSDDTLVDLFNKVVTGREAFAAAGDLAVTFPTALADANYTVLFSFEDVSGGANDLVGQVKTGTKLAAGFTVTIAGTTPNGVMHWVAIHD